MTKGTASMPPKTPVDKWEGRLPHRVLFSVAWPSFVIKGGTYTQLGEGSQYGPFLMQPTKKFQKWISDFGIGVYEIVFWEDIVEAHFRSTSDTPYPDAFSVGFENINDAVIFKMWWT